MTPAEDTLSDIAFLIAIILLAGATLSYLRSRFLAKYQGEPYITFRDTMRSITMGAPQPAPVEAPPCPACGTPMGEDMQCPNTACEAG